MGSIWSEQIDPSPLWNGARRASSQCVRSSGRRGANAMTRPPDLKSDRWLRCSRNYRRPTLQRWTLGDLLNIIGVGGLTPDLYGAGGRLRASNCAGEPTGR